jgi:hypothetical protein
MDSFSQALTGRRINLIDLDGGALKWKVCGRPVSPPTNDAIQDRAGFGNDVKGRRFTASDKLVRGLERERMEGYLPMVKTRKYHILRPSEFW